MGGGIWRQQCGKPNARNHPTKQPWGNSTSVGVVYVPKWPQHPSDWFSCSRGQRRFFETSKSRLSDIEDLKKLNHMRERGPTKPSKSLRHRLGHFCWGGASFHLSGQWNPATNLRHLAPGSEEHLEMTEENPVEFFCLNGLLKLLEAYLPHVSCCNTSCRSIGLEINNIIHCCPGIRVLCGVCVLWWRALRDCNFRVLSILLVGFC